MLCVVARLSGLVAGDVRLSFVSIAMSRCARACVCVCVVYVCRVIAQAAGSRRCNLRIRSAKKSVGSVGSVRTPGSASGVSPARLLGIMGVPY